MYTIITLCTIMLTVIPYQAICCSTKEDYKHPTIPPIVIPARPAHVHTPPPTPHVHTPPPISRANSLPPIVIPARPVSSPTSSHSSTNTPPSPHAPTPPPIPRTNAFSPREIARIRAGIKQTYN